VPGEGVEHIGNLQRELTGRHEDQRQWPVRLGRARQAGEQRNAERERLAGTCSGSAAHVAAGHRDGNGPGLDRERLGEANRGDGGVDFGGNAERGETGRRGNRRDGGCWFSALGSVFSGPPRAPLTTSARTESGW
jgi:hypothetical protein